MIKYRIFSLLVLFNFFIKPFAQETVNLAEKFYLHTDRKNYVAGEAIQFKAYSLNVQTDKVASISKVLYINLVDKDGVSVEKKKFRISVNGAYGSIKIPENINSGYYFIYAYTKWQRNFGLDAFAVKKIFIVNSQRGISYANQKVATKKYEMLFFPESGRINSGMKNQIGFYVKDIYDQPVATKGKILDEKGNVVALFESKESCFGTFSLEPKSSVQYRALAYVEGDSMLFDLPKSQAADYSFSIDKSADNYVSITRSKPVNGLFDSKLKLEIEYNSFTYMSFADSIPDKEFNIRIPKKSFIPGANRVVFRNLNNEIIYDCMIDVYRKELMDINLQANKNVFSTHEKVMVNLRSMYFQQPQANANLSVSVYKLENQENTFDFSNIATSSLVSPVLTENLNFQHVDIKDIYKNLNDYLLCTNHSKKEKEEIKFLPETKEPYISGIIQNINENKAFEPDLTIFATFLDSLRTTYAIIPDTLGEFLQVFPNKSGSNEVIFQSNEKSSNYKLIFDNDFADTFPQFNTQIPLLKESTKEYFKKLMLNYQLNKQYGNDIQQEKTGTMSGDLFYGIPDSSYVLNKYIDLPTMEEVFNNIIIDVLVKKKKNGHTISVYDENRVALNFSPLILVDGIPVMDLETVLKINPLKVKKISLINSNYLIGERFFGGIISIFSKENDFAGIKLPPSAKIVDYESITPSENILSNDFSNSKMDKHIPDLRNTIYWNPEIITDKTGSANFSFYTSDETGKFIIKVEGLSAEGSPGVGYFVYEVKK